VYKFTEGVVVTHDHRGVQQFHVQFPNSLRMECTQCNHDQPWDVLEPNHGAVYLHLDGFEGPRRTYSIVKYSCRACRTANQYWFFMKIGQYPPLWLEPPALVASGMEKDDLALYRKALTCRNSSFGIAAVAYLRRIVENRTNFLIDLIAARQQEEDPTSALLARVESIKRDRRFSEKIEFARDLLPKSIRFGGQNPISLLHELTSEAIHGLSDEESVDVFDRCQLAFEHVIKRLKQDHDEDESYKEALKKLTEKAAGKPKL